MARGVSAAVFSAKGGVGKTIFTINLAGVMARNEKKVLIIDLDLYSGGIALALDRSYKKDIYNFCDDYNNNRYKDFEDYVVKYNEYIDVLPCPTDPRRANKIDAKYLKIILDKAVFKYDFVLVDMSHAFDEINVNVLDIVDKILLMTTNDPLDLKNMRNLIQIFKSTDKTNYFVVLNCSRDTGRDYLSLFDIRNILKCNIDYTIGNSFYIKNIDKYVLNGEILTLNRSVNRFHGGDVAKLKKIALKLLESGEEESEQEESN